MPGLRVVFRDEASGDRRSGSIKMACLVICKLPSPRMLRFCLRNLTGALSTKHQTVDWAVQWGSGKRRRITGRKLREFDPNDSGGHARQWFAQRYFRSCARVCEHHDLLPTTVKIIPEDIWQNCAFVVSVKMQEAQFSGQTKERLTSRECAGFVTQAVKDALSLWLNQHVEEAKSLVEWFVRSRKTHAFGQGGVTKKKFIKAQLCRENSQIARRKIHNVASVFLVEGDSAVARLNKRAIANNKPFFLCAERF